MAHQWYIRSGVKEQGPFSSAQLKKLAEQRRIKQDSIVRRGEAGKWVHASKVKGLFPPTESPKKPIEELAEASPSDRGRDATNPPHSAHTSSRRFRLVVFGSAITLVLILVGGYLFYRFRLPPETRDLLTAVNTPPETRDLLTAVNTPPEVEELLAAVNDVEVEMQLASKPNASFLDAFIAVGTRDPDLPTVPGAMEKIKAHGSEKLAAQALEQLLRSKSMIQTKEAEFVSAKALDALGDLGQNSIDAQPLIEKLLYSPKDRIRKFARNALIEIKPVREWPAWLKHANKTDRELAVRALSEKYTPEPDVISDLVPFVDRGPSKSRFHALEVLLRYGPKAKPALPSVIRFLKNYDNSLEDRESQLAAIVVLLRIGPDAREAVPILQAATSEIYHPISLMAHAAIAKIAPDTRDQHIKPILEAAKSSHMGTRVFVIETFKRMETADSVILDLLRTMQRDQEEIVRLYAKYVVLQLTGQSEAAASQLKTMKENGKTMIRQLSEAEERSLSVKSYKDF